MPEGMAAVPGAASRGVPNLVEVRAPVGLPGTAWCATLRANARRASAQAGQSSG